MIRLAHFLQREGNIAHTAVFPLSIVAGLSRGMLIVLVNAALQPPGPTAALAVAAIVVTALHLISFYFARLATSAFVERVQNTLRLELVQLLNRAEAALLFNLQEGDLQNILNTDIQRVAGSSVQLFADFQAIILVLFCLTYTFWVSVTVGATALMGFCSSALICLLCDTRARPSFARAQSAMSHFLNVVNDTIRGFKELRLNSAKREALEADLAATLGEARDYSLRSERLISLSTVVAQIGLFAIIGSVVFVLPLAGLIERSQAVEIFTVTLFAYGPIESVLRGYSSISRANVSLDRLLDMRRRLSARREPSAPVPVGAAAVPSFHSIRFDGVLMQFGNRATLAASSHASDSSHEFILGPLELTVTAGEILFLHGNNGSGKTTLLTALSGLRQPDAGRIFLNGKPVAATDSSRYRSLFSAVFSDFHLFSHFYALSPLALRELRENLGRFGLSKVVDVASGRIRLAALSAGQRRRLALCIALAEARPILLLDEFVADQDPFYRAYFYEQLLPELRHAGRTVVAVSHDEHRFDLCDRLIKMADGRIVEETAGRLSRPTAVPTAR